MLDEKDLFPVQFFQREQSAYCVGAKGGTLPYPTLTPRFFFEELYSIAGERKDRERECFSKCHVCFRSSGLQKDRAVGLVIERQHVSKIDVSCLLFQLCCCSLCYPRISVDLKTRHKHLPSQGDHVLIDRTSKRSQFRSFKQAVTLLNDGVSIMAFPEGARSPDGRLMPFKGGIFSMAVKAQVPIVPLSLANTHTVMPSIGLMPVQSGRGKLRVFVHEAICVEGKSEEEIAREVKEALLSELPADQHPLEE